MSTLQEPAKAVREAIRSGSSTIKDRLFIKLENDMRYGEVRMDHWLMNAKVRHEVHSIQMLFYLISMS